MLLLRLLKLLTLAVKEGGAGGGISQLERAGERRKRRTATEGIVPSSTTCNDKNATQAKHQNLKKERLRKLKVSSKRNEKYKNNKRNC